jgi:hypothetical protein
MGWLIVIIAFCLALFYLLFAPFYIEIDTERQIFRFQFHSWFQLRLIMKQDSFFIVVKILKWTKSWDIFSMKKQGVKRVRSPRNRGSNISKHKVISIIKSFRLRKFKFSIDTGDMPTNGLLFPVFHLIKLRTQLDISINFKDENKFFLLIENNLARLIGALIFTKSNK